MYYIYIYSKQFFKKILTTVEFTIFFFDVKIIYTYCVVHIEPNHVLHDKNTRMISSY